MIYIYIFYSQDYIMEYLTHTLHYINHHIMLLDNSKFFAGIMMIILNIGSKFIQIQFSKSTEEYLKFSLSKQLLVFAMAWMGTRNIYIALGLTAVFTILSDHLFNEESRLCIVPHHYRVLHNIQDPYSPEVTDTELASAIAILEKAKREKQKQTQKDAYSKFNFEKFNLG